MRHIYVCAVWRQRQNRDSIWKTLDTATTESQQSDWDDVELFWHFLKVLRTVLSILEKNYALRVAALLSVQPTPLLPTRPEHHAQDPKSNKSMNQHK